MPNLGFAAGTSERLAILLSSNAIAKWEIHSTIITVYFSLSCNVQSNIVWRSGGITLFYVWKRDWDSLFGRTGYGAPSPESVALVVLSCSSLAKTLYISTFVRRWFDLPR